MTRDDLAAQLLAAADIADELPHGELQVLMRRAALRLRSESTGTIYLDEDLVAVFDKIVAEVDGPMLTRNAAVNAALRDWAIGHDHLPTMDVDEESGTDGTA